VIDVRVAGLYGSWYAEWFGGIGASEMSGKQQVWVVHYENWFDSDWETFASESDARDVYAAWLSDHDVMKGATVSLRRVDGWSLELVESHGEEQLNRTDTGWTCWLWDLAKGGEIVLSAVVK